MEDRREMRKEHREAMQERRVTVQGRTYPLEPPFFVFATQNPIELEGTYPLPEAQMDRFMFKINVSYPARSEELEIVSQRLVPKQDSKGRFAAVEVLLNSPLIADLIIKGISGAIAAKTVTYDFERLMPGATLLRCSEFGEAIIANMDA